MKRRKLTQMMEEREFTSKAASSRSSAQSNTAGHAASPSGEGSQDPAPTRHDAGTGSEARGREKSKFEPSEQYRTKRGDRFS